MLLYVFIIGLTIVRLDLRYFKLLLFVHIVRVIELSLLLMPSVIFTLLYVMYSYCHTIGRLVLLLLIN